MLYILACNQLLTIYSIIICIDLSNDLKRNIGVSKSISEGVILKKMNEIKVKKAKDLAVDDATIIYGCKWDVYCIKKLEIG